MAESAGAPSPAAAAAAGAAAEGAVSDEVLRRRVWSGAVAVAFVLSSGTPLARSAPQLPQLPKPSDPYYAMIPRNSYVLLGVAPAHDFFSAFVERPEDLWVSVGGEPLPWHLPVGVLFDVFGRGARPWKLTLHYGEFPRERILHWTEAQNVHDHVFNTLKESSYLRQSSVNPIMNMSEPDHRQIWAGVLTNEYDLYWQMIAPLIQETLPKNVPFRVVLDGGSVLQRCVGPEVSERAAPPAAASGSADAAGASDADSAAAATAAAATVRPSTVGDAVRACGVVIGPFQECIVQGVAVQPKVPLLPLYRTSMCVDGFLYITIRNTLRS